ncbi:MAG: signal peptidase II [Ignavibacteria bacterium]
MRVLYFTFGVIFVDQFSKFFIKGINIPFLNLSIDGMYLGESINVIGSFLKITFIENPGMAFGFNPGSSFKLWISIFSLLASIGLFAYLFRIRKRTLTLRIAIALILGGAVGNLIDRMFYGIIYDYAPVFYGRVVDFFDFDFFNFTIFGRNYDRWPIFNIADAAVSIGVLIIVLFHRHHKDENDSAKENGTESRTTIQAADHSNINEEVEAGSEEAVKNDKTDKGKEIPI